jgi:two-component system chemotaxis response regulator CheY
MTPAAPALIIDDEWMMVEVMIAILRKLMYPKVDVAAEGASALSMLMKKPYSLVVSDLNMEGMGGLELFRNMQADPELRDIPFILTTASLAPRHVVAAKQAGVRHYLLKPFTPGQLAQKIASIREESPLSPPPALPRTQPSSVMGLLDEPRFRPSA